MTDEDIQRIESTLEVELPAAYRSALVDHGLSGSDDDHPEFRTDPELLINDNSHFKEDPEDISQFKKSGLLGLLGFWFMYGSGKRLRNHRKKWHKQWTKGRRFLIGDDQSEERYYIVLSEPSTSVYRYSLESQRSTRVAPSIQEWLEKVRQLMAEAASETFSVTPTE